MDGFDVSTAAVAAAGITSAAVGDGVRTSDPGPLLLGLAAALPGSAAAVAGPRLAGRLAAATAAVADDLARHAAGLTAAAAGYTTADARVAAVLAALPTGCASS